MNHQHSSPLGDQFITMLCLGFARRKVRPHLIYYHGERYIYRLLAWKCALHEMNYPPLFVQHDPFWWVFSSQRMSREQADSNLPLEKMTNGATTLTLEDDERRTNELPGR